jgi:triosephosphate isomerase
LAYEPPELIASKTASVISKENEIKELISFFNSSIPSLPSIPSLTLGAGIRTHEDIEKSKEFGAAGILISSAVMEGNQEEIKKLLG